VAALLVGLRTSGGKSGGLDSRDGSHATSSFRQHVCNNSRDAMRSLIRWLSLERETVRREMTSDARDWEEVASRPNLSAGKRYGRGENVLVLFERVAGLFF